MRIFCILCDQMHEEAILKLRNCQYCTFLLNGTTNISNQSEMSLIAGIAKMELPVTTPLIHYNYDVVMLKPSLRQQTLSFKMKEFILKMFLFQEWMVVPPSVEIPMVLNVFPGCHTTFHLFLLQ